MSDAPLIPDGTYRARARSVTYSATSDGVPYVEVEIVLLHRPRLDPQGHLPRLHWRGPMSRFGAIRSARALLAMGAYTDEKADTGIITGGFDPSLDFLIDVTSLECDEREAAGKWRTFARNPRRLP